MKPIDVINCVDEAMKMLYRTTVNYVAEHQGDKGFILTCTNNETNIKNDVIWAIHMDCCDGLMEQQVKAVRVEHGTLQIIVDDMCISYSDNDVKELRESEWYLVDDDDYVYYYPTLYSVASYIEQYVKE